jgi:hypothetical protein
MTEEIEKLNSELEDVLNAGVGPKVARFALACLSGVPYAGGPIGAVAGAWSDAEQDHFKKLLASWLKLQEDEIREIGKTLIEVMVRLNKADENTQKRVESPEYLSLVRKAFRDWSAAESEEKRILIRNLLSNAAGTKVCGDDIIRLFIEWIDRYSEGHFRVIREIFLTPGKTRLEIWEKIHGKSVREDSAEADLFKLYVHDLSVGHVIRQHRETDYLGRFIKPAPKKPTKTADHYMTSAFDDEKQYELTELGKWFVHYTMNEIVPKLKA